MDRTAKLWHIEYTHPLRVYAGHEQDGDVVKFHPNCNYVATGGSDKTIRLWSHSDAKMVSFEFGAFRLEESNEQGMFTLENPKRYPRAKGPIQVLEGRSPEVFQLE